MPHTSAPPNTAAAAAAQDTSAVASRRGSQNKGDKEGRPYRTVDWRRRTPSLAEYLAKRPAAAAVSHTLRTPLY
jgi:hypothetical protein